MHYLGGKQRISKEIVKILENNRKKDQIFVEPFVGSANIVSKMSGKRYAFDKHSELIEMYKALQNGWIPPNFITFEEYQIIKESTDNNHLKGFVGFGCSFSGKYFGGYARDNTGRNYCLNAKNSLTKKMITMSDVIFECIDYKNLEFNDALIYCDPPYFNTTKFKFEFDSNEFWKYMRKWSINNTVIISEYVAPNDFECIWSKEVKTDLRTKLNGKETRIEKLFKLKCY